MTAKPNVRYYARFRGDNGKVNAFVRYKYTRKCLTTPFNISREQLSRLTSDGRLNNYSNTSDSLLEGRLQDWARVVRNVCNGLIREGKFEQTPSAWIAAAVRVEWYEKKLEFRNRVKPIDGLLTLLRDPERAFEIKDATIRSEILGLIRARKELNQLTEQIREEKGGEK